MATALHHAGPGGTVGWQIMVIGVLCVPAYAVTLQRGDWRMLAAPAGILIATALGWAISLATGTAWDLTWSGLLITLVVWAAWPELPPSVGPTVLWAAAITPLIMLLIGPPISDLSWLGDLFAGRRVGRNAGMNELGIASALAAVAILALRAERDSWPRFTAQAAILVIAGATGTRSAFPAVLVAGIAWFHRAGRRRAWRGPLVETLPWALSGLIVLQTVVLRTTDRFSEGIDRVGSGRLSIWREYWSVATDALWSGHGTGATDVLRSGGLETTLLPHNTALTLVVEVGVPGAVVALAGFATVVVHRTLRVAGDERWLLRVPLVVLLPSIAMLDHPMRKASLTVPILVFAAAAPAWSRRVSRPPG